MGWPVNSTTDEARVKWKIAMKFLIPVKFDVNRAINLYRTHEVRRILSSKSNSISFFFFRIYVKMKISIEFGLITLILFEKFIQINFFHWYKYLLISIKYSILFLLSVLATITQSTIDCLFHCSTIKQFNIEQFTLSTRSRISCITSINLST
jgi:hypothetical protein